jgi:hypothetical protein
MRPRKTLNAYLRENHGASTRPALPIEMCLLTSRLGKRQGNLRIFPCGDEALRKVSRISMNSLLD